MTPKMSPRYGVIEGVTFKLHKMSSSLNKTVYFKEES